MSDLIDRYLDEPRRALWGDPDLKERILWEVEDYLFEGVEREQTCGAPLEEAQRRAIERFGLPQLIAHLSAAELAAKEGGTMWQRFTERARSVVLSAHEEARRLGEGLVGAEHLLLGLVREDNLPNLGTGVLMRLGATPDRIQSELAPQLTHGDNLSGAEMQLTPQSKRVIDLAYAEAKALNHAHIGTEHLLLALLLEGEGVAWMVLSRLGVDVERARGEIPGVGAAPVADAELPHVHLLGTGGTIAVGTTGSLAADELVTLVPGLASVASLTAEEFVRIGSSCITPEIQFGLARRVNELFASDPSLAGIVITHGTDTLEETAFFLDLLVTGDRPVVFAAAQRPPREADSDGPRNLLNAIRIAASPLARGMGVLVTLNDEIHPAREVRKTRSIALDAFNSPPAGPIGYLDGSHVIFARKPLRRLTLAPDAIETRVELITLAAGSDGYLLQAAVDHGAQAIVLEVFGRGNVPPQVMDAVRTAREKGVIVVFTSRTRGGRAEVDANARELGVLSGEDLDGLKARMLLVPALGETRDPRRLQSFFAKLAGA
jgi:L-asparaginase